MTSESPSLYQIEKAARAALQSATGLPGSAAHLEMSPRPRRGWDPGIVPDGARQAAGLVLLYPIGRRVHVLLTVRSGSLSSHAGQVSFPGGMIEPNETLPEAALRETSEEVGVETSVVNILGPLSTLYIPASDFALHPILGTTPNQPPFHPAEEEVSRILEPSLAALRNDGPRRGYSWRGKRRLNVPYFDVEGERVWGATAMILSEVLALTGAPVRDPWLHEPTSAPAPQKE